MELQDKATLRPEMETNETDERWEEAETEGKGTCTHEGLSEEAVREKKRHPVFQRANKGAT